MHCRSLYRSGQRVMLDNYALSGLWMIFFYVQRLSKVNMRCYCVSVNENVVILKLSLKILWYSSCERWSPYPWNLEACVCLNSANSADTLSIGSVKLTLCDIWGGVIKGDVSCSFARMLMLTVWAMSLARAPWSHHAVKPSHMERSCYWHTGCQFWYFFESPWRHWVKGPPDESVLGHQVIPNLWVLPVEVPGIVKQRQATPAMPHPNSWATEPLNINKW